MSEEEVKENFFDEDAGPRQVILDDLKIGQVKNECLTVTCRVSSFTFEAKAGEYQTNRGYVQVEPEGLYIHTILHDPDQSVDDDGDVGIFAAVFRQVARAVDAEVFDVASRRQDLRTAQADLDSKTAPKRFDAGKEVTRKKDGESL